MGNHSMQRTIELQRSYLFTPPTTKSQTGLLGSGRTQEKRQITSDLTGNGLNGLPIKPPQPYQARSGQRGCRIAAATS
jgi:hypothetical protein